MQAETREQSKCSLAAEVLRSRWGLQLRVRGASMLPTLWPGDLLTIQSASFDQVQSGDVVLYQHEERFFVVHRVVSKARSRDNEPEWFLIARGDCMSMPDAPIRPDRVLGKVTSIERAGLVFAPRNLSTFRSILAWILRHCNLLQRVVLRLDANRNNSDSRFQAAFFRVAS
jgi:signal peptidase I